MLIVLVLAFLSTAYVGATQERIIVITPVYEAFVCQNQTLPLRSDVLQKAYALLYSDNSSNITFQCQNETIALIECYTLQEMYEQQLQGSFSISSNTILHFFDGVHTIESQTPGHFIIRDNDNITLTALQGKPIIRCIQKENFGIVLVNISNLVVTNLAMQGCGAGINADLAQDISSVQSNSYSNLPLKPGLQVALLAVNIRSIKMSEVNVSYSSGYGLLGINLIENSVILNSALTFNNLGASKKECLDQSLLSELEAMKCQGGNALFIFADLPKCPKQVTAYNFTISYSAFSNGINLITPSSTKIYATSSCGSGISISMNQRNFGVFVKLINNFFKDNIANEGANIYLAMLNTVVNSSIEIHKTTSMYGNKRLMDMSKLRGSMKGSGLCFYHGIMDSRPSQNDCNCDNIRSSEVERELVLLISNSMFYHNIGGIEISFAGYPAPGINQVIRTVIINESLILDNWDSFALHAVDFSSQGLSKQTELVLDSVNITDNKYTNIDTYLSLDIESEAGIEQISSTRFNSVSNVTIRSCNFKGNHFSAIGALQSFIYFEGQNNFENNIAPSGAALYLTQDSTAYLRPDTHLIFTNNHATRRGGAIYIKGSANELNTVLMQCSIQVYDPTLLPIFELKTEMIFINNSATHAGDAVYGVTDNCSTLVPSGFVYHNKSFSGWFMFDFVSNFTGQPKSNSLISSDAFDIQICTTDQYDSTKYHTVSKYPGESLQIPLVALGQRNGSVPAVVNTLIVDNSTTTRALRQTERECTNITYDITSNEKEVLFVISVGGVPISQKLKPALQIHVTLLPCPVGFDLGIDTRSCKCDNRLKQRNMTECDIDTRTITRLPPYWLSNYSDHLLIHDHCPYDYCISTPVQITMQEPNISKQCAFNRTGILCGQCKEGLSVVFGSSRCLLCPHDYLTQCLLFTIAGIALVGFLFLLNLTVSIGTINGLIFYANIVKINEAIFFPPGENSPLKVFISWVNLDLGIETCFYNGMDSYAKTWLQFIFPLYMWVIMWIIVIGARKSITLARLCGNNAVPVLATIFLLSFTKLLRVITTVLSLTTLNYLEGQKYVWLYDGNVVFGEKKHTILFSFAIIFLVALFPYTVIIATVQFLRRWSEEEYLEWISTYKPIFDAYLGPYKDKYGYWTGLLLVFRVVLVLVFVFNIFGDPAVNLLAITLVVLALILLNLGQGGVYKSNYLTALETSYMVNLILLTVVTGHVRQTKRSQKMVIFISTFVAFVMFVGILVHQLYNKVNGFYQKWQERKVLEQRYEMVSEARDNELYLEQNEQEPGPIEHVVDIHLREAETPSQFCGKLKEE